MSESTQRPAGAPAAVAAVLFACLFAAQAAVIALSPVLPAVAADLHVSTAGAGQLRTVLGLAAGITALAVGRAAGRLSLRALLLVGVGLLAGGSAASAAAPTFGVLALAQVVIGSGVAIVIAAGSAAAAEWTAPEHRARVFSWALMGQPASWIVGMPLVGVLGGTSWRLGWIALPLLAAIVAAFAVATRPAAAAPVVGHSSRDALADAGVRGWVLSELLVGSGWAGTLVYVGALCADVYGTSPTAIGFVLAAGAVAFVAGNFAFRRFVGTDVRVKLIGLSPAVALGVLLLGTVRPSLAVTAALFSAAAFVAGGRTLLGSAYGLELRPERRLAVMGLRAAATQFGYFVGTATAGAALAAYGWTGFGVATSMLLAASSLPLLAVGGLRLRPAAISL